MVSGFVRSVLLARLLLPEYFGVVALATFFLSLTTQIQRFGLGKAFIQQRDDSPDHLTTFATLRIGLTVIAVVLSLAAAPILARLYPKQHGLALVLAVFALLELFKALNAVPQAILSRDLRFQRLALLDIVSSLAMTVIAPIVAWLGAGVWALVVERAVGVVVSTAGMWFYRRPWRPVFGLDRSLLRQYLHFSAFVFVGNYLAFLLDQFDDFWTGTFLGPTALGLYSRAYEFARYPRRVLAGPVAQVFFPTFAQLQDDRLRLSKAFYRACSLIVRVGFLAFGAFALVVPEFVRIFLGDEWLPMASTFRLMLAYTLLDPVVSICRNLLKAVGRPRAVAHTHMIQAVVFVPAVILAAQIYGINGVAIAADIMLLIGISLLFRQTKRHVDFSLQRMFCVPALSLGLGCGAALGLSACIALTGDWISLLSKAALAAVVYLVVSMLLERHEYIQNGRLLWSYVRLRQVQIVAPE
jgi:O-antigen/teichoic acid export membrane protein